MTLVRAILGIAAEDLHSTYNHTPSVVATMDWLIYEIIPVEDWESWALKQKQYFCGEDRIGEYEFREVDIELDDAKLSKVFETMKLTGEVTPAS